MVCAIINSYIFTLSTRLLYEKRNLRNYHDKCVFSCAAQRMYMLCLISDVDQFKADLWSAAKSHTRRLLDSSTNVHSSVVRKKHFVLGKQTHSEKMH